MPQNSYLQSPITAPNQRRHHKIDATGQVLGRMATRTATLLRGKHKPTYTAYVDCGDHVTITNAAKIRLTGNKLDQKTYFSHSGYAGGCKTTPLRRQMEKDPRKVVYLAVKRMINANRLRSRQLARLKIYPGEQPKIAAKPAKAS